MRKSLFIKLVTVLLILVCIGGLAYYFYAGVKDTAPTGNTQKDPETTALEFYKWYIDFLGHPIKSGAYKNITLLTARYKNELAEINLAQRINDPVLCAQDKPYKYKVAEVFTDEATSRVVMEQDYYGITVKSNVLLVLVDGHWYVDGVECSEPEPTDTTNANQIIVYLLNESRKPKKFASCGIVYGVARTLENLGENRYEKIMQFLFAGPNAPERAQGYTSTLIFSDLLGVKVNGNVAYVNISSALKDRVANSSCNVQNLTAQISETLKHRKEVTKVIYAFDGNPTAFYEWSQLGCTTDASGLNYCDPTPFAN